MNKFDPLTFRELDGITLAAKAQRLAAYSGRAFHLADIGPWVEMILLASAGQLETAPPGLFASEKKTKPLEDALKISSVTSQIAPIPATFVLRPSRPTLNEEHLAQLYLAALNSAPTAAMAKPLIKRITSALTEVYDNIFEHSGATETGLAAFRALPRTFEFVVADRGVGVLASLKQSPRFCDLIDHGEALQCALRPDVSRHEEAGRGHGFDRLVEGLANLRSELRFRTGDAVFEVSGLGAGRPTSTLARRAPISGFSLTAKFYAA